MCFNMYQLRYMKVFCISADLSRFRPVYAPKDFLEVSRALARQSLRLVDQVR